MKITVKQLNHLIMEALKEQATASGWLAVNRAAQAVMNYAAMIRGQRGYIAALSSRNPTQIQAMRRQLLSLGNTAKRAIDNVRATASTYRNINRITGAMQRIIDEVQQELVSTDMSTLDRTTQQTTLSDLGNRVVRNVYGPLQLINRGIAPRVGTRAPAGLTPEQLMANPPTDAEMNSLAKDIIASLPGGTPPAMAMGRVEDVTQGLGTLTLVPEPGYLPEPELRDTGPVQIDTPRIDEAVLRRFIKQEVKKYLR